MGSHQNIGEFMKDLTGMPTKTFKVRRLDQAQLRYCWSRNFIVIAQTNSEFTKKFVPGPARDKGLYCTLQHAFCGEDGKLILEFKEYCNKINKTTDFHIAEKVQIEEDWKKVRGYTKVE